MGILCPVEMSAYLSIKFADLYSLCDVGYTAGKTFKESSDWGFLRLLLTILPTSSYILKNSVESSLVLFFLTSLSYIENVQKTKNIYIYFL